MARKKHHGSGEVHAHRMHKVMGGHYEGHDPRRRQEMEDAGMIREDHSAIANLPQGVEMKPWGSYHAGMPEDLDDTIHGIDKQIGMDDAKRRAHFMPKKV